MNADPSIKKPDHLQAPIKAYADEEMVRNAVGDQYDRYAEPPEVDAPREHPLCDAIIKGLRSVYDPEIPVNIYELGLIYRIGIVGEGEVRITMTLTSPGCPVAQEMPGMVRAAVFPIDGVSDVEVEIIWDPTWTPAMMAETAKMQLNMFT